MFIGYIKGYTLGVEEKKKLKKRNHLTGHEFIYLMYFALGTGNAFG